MIIHVVLAGIDKRFHDGLRAAAGSLERRVKGVRVTSLPLTRFAHTPAYPRAYVLGLAGALAREVLKVVSDEQAALVAYVPWDQSSHLLIDQFAKYALLHSVRAPEDHELAHKHFSQEINRILDDVRIGLDKFMQIKGCLRREVVDNRNRTPLLLPTRNFNSDILGETLRQVALRLPTAKDADEATQILAEVTQNFLRHHPQVQISEGKWARRWAHQSREGLIFRSPGTHLHADFEDAPGHQIDCRLGAYLRVGHSYPEGFHYDTNYARAARTLDGARPSCHGQHQPRGGLGYLNISPNDFVRDGI